MSRTAPFPVEQAVLTLTLVAASLDLTSEPVLTLSFDRPVDVAGIDPSQVTVIDGAESIRTYVGSGVDGQPTAESVTLLLSDVGPAAPAPTVMNASAATGIVAVDDGGTWPGVTDLELPFP